jgi:secondary thiamine-phosphate synthase enzyme
MTTLTAAPPYRHTTVRISTTCPTEFIDLTDELAEIVADSGIRFGFVNVQTRHTTSAIVVNETEPLLFSDFAAFFERAAPSDIPYRHDDPTVRHGNVMADGRINGHSHCRALVLGASTFLNIADGRLQLGTWQRVLFVELDGPREREISVLILGSGC